MSTFIGICAIIVIFVAAFITIFVIACKNEDHDEVGVISEERDKCVDKCVEKYYAMCAPVAEAQKVANIVEHKCGLTIDEAAEVLVTIDEEPAMRLLAVTYDLSKYTIFYIRPGLCNLTSCPISP
jgi:hypothetical protein